MEFLATILKDQGFIQTIEGEYKLSIDGSAPALCSPTVNDDNNCSGWHIPFVKNTAPFANAGFNRYVLLNQPFVLSGANSFDLGYGSCDVDQTTENLLFTTVPKLSVSFNAAANSFNVFNDAGALSTKSDTFVST